MTKPFSTKQKLRILVWHGAVALHRGEFVPIARLPFGTMNAAKRYARLMVAGCAVKCACGCEVWAKLQDIDFDHDRDFVSGGPTVIANGRPLRRQPCHAAKSARARAVTGKVTRARRKLRVREKPTSRDGDQPSPPQRARTRSSIPSRLFPKVSRPFPQRREARP